MTSRFDKNTKWTSFYFNDFLDNVCHTMIIISFLIHTQQIHVCIILYIETMYPKYIFLLPKSFIFVIFRCVTNTRIVICHYFFLIIYCVTLVNDKCFSCHKQSFSMFKMLHCHRLRASICDILMTEPFILFDLFRFSCSSCFDLVWILQFCLFNYFVFYFKLVSLLFFRLWSHLLFCMCHSWDDLLKSINWFVKNKRKKIRVKKQTTKYFVVLKGILAISFSKHHCYLLSRKESVNIRKSIIHICYSIVTFPYFYSYSFFFYHFSLSWWMFWS